MIRCYDALNRKYAEKGITGASNTGSCPTGGTANTGARWYDIQNRGFSYDLLGRLTTANNAAWSQVWAYDARNTITSYANNIGTFTRTFDMAGNLTRLQGPGNYVIGYGYDALNRMTSATYTPAGGSAATVATLTYDSLGRRSGVTFGDGSTTTYGYDLLDRLTSLAHGFPSSGSNVTFSYAYDPGNRIVSRSGSNTAYDYVGAASSLAYAAANAVNKYLTVGGQPFYWWPEGPLNTDLTQNYYYDETNALINAQSKTTTASVVYSPVDALGRAIYRQTSDQTVNTLTYLSGEGASASNAIEQMFTQPMGSSGWTYQGTRQLIQGPGADEFLAYVDTSGAIYYPHTDERGSAIALSQSGAAPTTFRYDPFGASADPIADGPTGAASYAYRYTGQRLDALSGLYNYKARAYEPGIGRFLQTDPAGLTASPNLYAYVGNNPVNGTDPTGMGFECDGYDEGIGVAGNCYYVPDSFTPYNPPSDNGSTIGGGGGAGGSVNLSASLNNKLPSVFFTPQSNTPKISCSTRLPNGQTVGQVVQKALANVGSAAGPYDVGGLGEFGAFFATVQSGGPIDFKNTLRGTASPAFLGAAGNFAYGAIASGIGYSQGVAEFGAGGYALSKSFGNPNSPYGFNPNNPFGEDNSAAQNLPAGYASAGCTR